jgi:membrane-associated protease RseP (regulator of RpoE activity)
MTVFVVALIACGNCFAQREVSFDISIVSRGNNSKEIPVPNQKIHVLLARGYVDPQYTKPDGSCRFTFPANPYFKVIIGGLVEGGVELYPMSGMRNQAMTLYNNEQQYTTTKAGGMDYLRIIQYANELDNAKDGSSMPGNLAKDLNQIKKKLIDQGQESDEHSERLRKRALEAIDEVYKPTGKLGITALSYQSGALIREIRVGGSADRSGIRPGDLIISVNDKNVNDSNLVQHVIADARDGIVNVKLVRNGQTMTFENIRLDY